MSSGCKLIYFFRTEESGCLQSVTLAKILQARYISDDLKKIVLTGQIVIEILHLYYSTSSNSADTLNIVLWA